MPTFVLVHGSTQNPSGWDLLRRELSRRGQESVSVDLPVNEPDAGASRYAEVIAAACAGVKDPIVAAHSVSGIFLPLVASRVPASRLVYVAAALPQPGMSFIDQYRQSPEMYNPAFVGRDPTADRETAIQFLFHDCGEATEWALTTLRLMNAKRAMTEVTPLERWPEVPSTYISCSEDRTLNPEWWERAAREQLSVEPIRMGGGHFPHVSRPAELADVLCSLIF
jgi:pimeloyl-ACP methyl ester carboxylesterase